MMPFRPAIAAALLIASFVLHGCAPGMRLQTHAADPKTISGNYDLILYGCRFPKDYEHAAFLISPDARYPVSLFVPDTSYKVQKGLPAEKALSEAKAFVRCGVNTVTETRVQSIPDGSGGTIGYEILPRYAATEPVGIDPLEVSYTLKDGNVMVYIRLSTTADRWLNRPSSPGY